MIMTSLKSDISKTNDKWSGVETGVYLKSYTKILVTYNARVF